MNVAVGVIFTCKVTVSEVLYWTEVGPVGYSKPAHNTNVVVSYEQKILKVVIDFFQRPTFYSDDSTSRGKQLTPVVQLAVISCGVRVSSTNV